MTTSPLKITLALAVAIITSCSSSDEDESKLNAVQKERVTGISQKGTFARGSKVTIHGLNSKWEKTKKSSEGETDDNGYFDIKIKNGELASPYIVLEVNGKYFNEVSGEITTTPITLNAIADVSNKSKVNVNILTHLEFERVLELVKSGKSFFTAKRQAQREVLEALGIDMGERGIMNSENLDIFGSGTGDAMLLVVSILFQGNRSVEELSSLLGKFSGEIRDKGTSETIIDEVKKELENVDIDKVRDYVWNQNPEAKEPDLSPYLPPKPPEIPSSSSIEPSSNSASPSPSLPGGNSGGGGQRRSSSSIAALPSSNSEHSSSSEDNSSSSHTSSSSSEEHSSSSEEHSSSSFRTFTDSRDSKSYKYVTIGEQEWMAENLNYSIGGVGKCYDNQKSNCTTYGRLYNWETAMTVCPIGWHLPRDWKWTELMNFAGATDAGKKLKATNGWGDSDNGEDIWGFAAMPGGRTNNEGIFDSKGGSGFWWTATNSSNGPYIRFMNSNYDIVGRDFVYAGRLYSVRCVQDKTFTDTRDGKTYKYVKIGTQTWMAENLNYDATDSRCYNDNPTNCTTYGRLYNLATAKTACPAGWHLPSNDEWTTLTNFIGATYGVIYAGKYLKANSDLWNINTGTDGYGFTALPGGGFYYGTWRDVEDRGFWWSSNESGYNLRMDDNQDDAILEPTGTGDLLSVRCVQN